MTLSKNNAVEWLEATSTVTNGRVKLALTRSGKETKIISSSTSIANSGISTYYWYADTTTTTTAEGGNFEGTGYTVVVEDASPSNNPPTMLYAIISDYPGIARTMMGTGSFVTMEKNANDGSVIVRQSLHFIRNANQGRNGGLHVHTGVSCQDPKTVGGHYFDGANDPWLTTKWSSVENSFTIPSSTDGMPSMSNMIGKAVIVHSEDGTRIGCGIISSKPHGRSKSFSIEKPNALYVVNGTKISGTRGSALLIKWTTSGYVAQVTVQMKSKTNTGATSITLAENVMNTGSLLINVPYTAVVNDDYVFTVSGSNAVVHSGHSFKILPDVDDASATTTEPHVQIIYPSIHLVEEGIQMNSKCRIIWEFTKPNVATHVSIHLSYSSSTSAPFVITASAVNNGIYEWTPSMNELKQLNFEKHGNITGEGTRYQITITPIDSNKQNVGRFLNYCFYYYYYIIIY
jgi:hypothetical protein